MNRHVEPDGSLVLCPYCVNPLSEETEAARMGAWQKLHKNEVPCDSCGLDITRDAPSEKSPAQWEALDHEPCPRCGGDTFSFAVYCSHCKQWKRDESDDT